MDDVSGRIEAGHETEDEPQFEAPPVFADQDERRMHVRAYNRWASLLNGREFPAPADLNSGKIDDFGPNSVLIDFREGRETPILRFIGSRLRAECGLDEAPSLRDPLDFDSVPARSLLSRLTDHYFEIIANRAPIGFEAEFTSRRGNNTLYRGILTPLSSDGSTIDYMYGVINWKELAEAELGQTLAREAGLIASVSPVEKVCVPFGDDADVARYVARYDDTNIAKPAVAPSEQVEAGAEAGLADRLAQARDAVDLLKGHNDRSRTALYTALSAAWDFYLDAEHAPADYAELLQDAGLKGQARAPMTPVVKLIFGTGYDKSRLTEFAAALSHAKRLGLKAGAFTDFIADFDGGLKALVKTERAARRDETSRPKVDRAATTRTQLRSRDPVAKLPLEVAGDDEFVLLVARRQADGSLGVMASVPHRDTLIDTALRSL